MNGIEKIQAKLAEDAKAELSALEADTKKQIADIESKAQAEAKALAEDILAKGKVQVAERAQRLGSSAEMESRKMNLAMKQEVITQAFETALQDLCNRPENEYVDLLVSMALASLTTGKETLIFSEKDKGSVGGKVVAKLNESIAAGKAPELPAIITDSKAGAFLEKVVKAVNAVVNQGSITLSEETRPLAGGFIMQDGDVELNCDFDTLVRLERNNLELEVANLLFS